MRTVAVLLSALLIGAGCVSTPGGSYRAAGITFLGHTDAGPGLYLLNAHATASTNDPNITICDVTTNLDILIMVANGYPTPVLIRKPGRSNLWIANLTCFDRAGVPIATVLGYRRGDGWPGYHRSFESLMERSRDSRTGVSVCCCGMQDWRVRRALDFSAASDARARPDEAGNETVIRLPRLLHDLQQDDDVNNPLILPRETDRVDLIVGMVVEYVVAGDPHWYKDEFGVRVRLLRRKDGPPDPKASPAEDKAGTARKSREEGQRCDE